MTSASPSATPRNASPVEEFNTATDLLIYVGTFNVESRLPYQPFDEWLLGNVLRRAQANTGAQKTQQVENSALPGTHRLELPHIYCLTFQEFGPPNTALLDANNGLIRSCTTMVNNALHRLAHIATLGQATPTEPNVILIPDEVVYQFQTTELKYPLPQDDLADLDYPLHYTLHASYHYAGMLTFIYTLDPVITPRVHNLQFNRAGCGPLFSGLKGALGISLELSWASQCYSFCFVGAHLTAHEHLAAIRNRNYHSLCHRLCYFPQSSDDSLTTHSARDIPAEIHRDTVWDQLPTRTLFDHDYVFFFGDLNYRTQCNVQQNLKVPINPATLSQLIKHDELKQVMKSGVAFEEFREDTIRFGPTYKFMVGCNIYVYRKRNPSWCDRILYWSKHFSGPDLSTSSTERRNSSSLSEKSGSSTSTLATKPVGLSQEQAQIITPLFYGAHFQYTCSDHRPVSGLYRVHLVPQSLTNPTQSVSAGMVLDPWWRVKLTIGWYIDRIIGHCWCLRLYLPLSLFQVTLILCSVLVLAILIFAVSPNEPLTKESFTRIFA
ncbi:hypothetical protein IWQ62_000743 [Dispira parvispora]|uniref:Inositol polyphosphate-related phosphatase domain-containing protein n=1 Tax=Dispira parvispora TaxID=1520584 RepID=A0A9W8AZF8_9FUNG|nr:hypothetical protein IWQ62_000743 [Dispira parvispora]